MIGAPRAIDFVPGYLVLAFCSVPGGDHNGFENCPVNELRYTGHVLNSFLNYTGQGENVGFSFFCDVGFCSFFEGNFVPSSFEN